MLLSNRQQNILGKNGCRIRKTYRRNELDYHCHKRGGRRFPKGDRKALWGAMRPSPVATKRALSESTETSGPWAAPIEVAERRRSAKPCKMAFHYLEEVRTALLNYTLSGLVFNSRRMPLMMKAANVNASTSLMGGAAWMPISPSRRGRISSAGIKNNP